MTPKRWNISPSLSLAWEFIDILFSQKDRFVLIGYTQGYNGRGSYVPELMLNIHMEGSKAYAQHFQLSFHLLQSFLFNTKVSNHVLHSSLLNKNHQSLMCSRAPRSTQIINHSCAPKLPVQHKTSYQSCASGSIPNTNKHIYIINNWLTPSI